MGHPVDPCGESTGVRPRASLWDPTEWPSWYTDHPSQVRFHFVLATGRTSDVTPRDTTDVPTYFLVLSKADLRTFYVSRRIGRNQSSLIVRIISLETQDPGP